jgi:hypothetical protein
MPIADIVTNSFHFIALVSDLFAVRSSCQRDTGSHRHSRASYSIAEPSPYPATKKDRRSYVVFLFLVPDSGKLDVDRSQIFYR